MCSRVRSCFLHSLALIILLMVCAAAPLKAQSSEPFAIANARFLTNGWFQLEIDGPAPMGYVIERSDLLGSWDDAALLLRGENFTNALPFIDAATAGKARFYRVQMFDPGTTNDWKNQVYYPGDAFLWQPLSFDIPEVRWIKFAIKTNEPARVYYQDSTRHPFHYDFAKARLPEFAGMSPAEFDAVSLHTNGQQVVLGTLLYAPHAETREIGVQFVGMDLYPAGQVADWFDLVRSTIVSDGPIDLFYVPTFEQQGAEQDEAYFAARGIELSSIARWGTGQDAYSYGWAVGTLKYVHGWAIEQAYATGELQPGDILLTDAVPAEVPYLAGILTLNPSTPNSHVAILARSYGVPFAWLASEAAQQNAQALVGKPVAVAVTRAFPGSAIAILDLSGVDPALREEIARLKDPPAIEITPKESYGAYMASTDDLDPSDIRFFGGKAANFGFLRREIPGDSPVAFAISFDLWDEFMGQSMATGKTLREEIAGRLAGYAYPPNVGQLQADLLAIREMIEDNTQFTPGQQEAIIAVLAANFDPQTKIRFRSSTNVEDSETFTGAGLYDSYSGCLADDLDGDAQGPSICEPEEAKERGVFRAIRKVYASFYNDNAFLERLRHGVDESEVGMAVLVHYSSPDPTEMANGVATVTFTKQTEGHYIQAAMVTQKGAISVTNPDNSALPEVVRVNRYFGTFAETRQWSSLMPYGANVLEWDDEYLAFVELFSKVAEGFEGYYPAKDGYTLDFEYKKIVPGDLLVKQVREIPPVDQETMHPRYLVDEPGEWCLLQGEFGNVFGNHRLKSRLHLSTRNVELSAANLEEPILREMSISFLDGGELVTLTGAPTEFPGSAHGQRSNPGMGTEVWQAWDAADGTRWTWAATVQTSGPASAAPVVTLQDQMVTLTAEYVEPVPGYDNFQEFGLVTNDIAWITPCIETNGNSIPVTRTVSAGPGTNITISFLWPEPPGGPSAGYTAPLAAWRETVINGLSTEPIVLRGYFSQTYRPGHHNFAEEFLFEPRLEEGISQEILAELGAKDIRLIHVYWDGGTQDRISVMGADNQMRRLGGKAAERPF